MEKKKNRILKKDELLFDPRYADFVSDIFSVEDYDYAIYHLVYRLNKFLCRERVELSVSSYRNRSVCVNYIRIPDTKQEKHKVFLGSKVKSFYFLAGWYFRYVFAEKFEHDHPKEVSILDPNGDWKKR